MQQSSGSHLKFDYSWLGQETGEAGREGKYWELYNHE